MKCRHKYEKVGHIAEYKYSPAGQRNISDSHVSCLNQ